MNRRWPIFWSSQYEPACSEEAKLSIDVCHAAQQVPELATYPNNSIIDLKNDPKGTFAAEIYSKSKPSPYAS